MKGLSLVGAICVLVAVSATNAFGAVDPNGKRPLASAATGGTVIFGADQEPRTLNTFTVEGNALWGSIVLQPVITFFSKYNNKGVLIYDIGQGATLNSKKPQVVTYRLKAAAKWSDNRQITADDMIFTFQQIMN